MKTSLKLIAIPLVIATLSACARNEAAEAPPAPPAVEAAKVITKSITEFDEFTGRFEAVERVEVRPRVSGYVTSARFQLRAAVLLAALVMFYPMLRAYDWFPTKAVVDAARMVREDSAGSIDFSL